MFKKYGIYIIIAIIIIMIFYLNKESFTSTPAVTTCGGIQYYNSTTGVCLFPPALGCPSNYTLRNGSCVQPGKTSVSTINVMPTNHPDSSYNNATVKCTLNSDNYNYDCTNSSNLTMFCKNNYMVSSDGSKCVPLPPHH